MIGFDHNDDFTFCQWGARRFYHRGLSAELIQAAWSLHCQRAGPVHYTVLFAMTETGTEQTRENLRLQHYFRGIAAPSLHVLLVSPMPGFWWINPDVPVTGSTADRTTPDRELITSPVAADPTATVGLAASRPTRINAASTAPEERT